MGAKAVPHLAQYLSDDNEDLSGSILDIIGEINDPGSASLVLRFMDQTASVELLCDSIKILGNLKHAGAVPKLVSTLNDSPETLFFAKDIQNVALATIWALGEIGSKSAVPHLLQFAKSNNKVIYLTAVADALGKINDAFLAILLDQLKHRDTSVGECGPPLVRVRNCSSRSGLRLKMKLNTVVRIAGPSNGQQRTAAIEQFVGMLKSGQPFTVSPRRTGAERSASSHCPPSSRLLIRKTVNCIRSIRILDTCSDRGHASAYQFGR